jgi:hypothetical protein
MPEDTEYLSGFLKRHATINPRHSKVLADGLWGGFEAPKLTAMGRKYRDWKPAVPLAHSQQAPAGMRLHRRLARGLF